MSSFFNAVSETFLILLNTPLVDPEPARPTGEVPLTDMPPRYVSTSFDNTSRRSSAAISEQRISEDSVHADADPIGASAAGDVVNLQTPSRPSLEMQSEATSRSTEL